jgi:hypothetical protein
MRQQTTDIINESSGVSQQQTTGNKKYRGEMRVGGEICGATKDRIFHHG